MSISKFLTLLRHAEAADAEDGQDDHDRPLTDAGRAAAASVGRASAADPPDLVLCSTALRTRQTFSEAARSWTSEPRVIYDSSLYLASTTTILIRIGRLGEATESLWVIGHNPGLFDLAKTLGGARIAKIAPEMSQRFPTAARARFSLEAPSWRDIHAGSVQLTEFVRVSR